MAKIKKSTIDLSKENLTFEERNQTIKLLNFKTETMSLDIAKNLIAVSGERYEYETNVLIETKLKNIL